MLRSGKNSATYFAKSSRLIEKWNKRIGIYESISRKPLSYDTKLVLSQCLENTENEIKLMESTDAGATNGYKTFAMDLVTSIVPNLTAQSIVALQPIDNSIGVINYIRYLYSDDKGQVKAGDEFASGILFSGSDPYYSSQEVVGEGYEFQKGDQGTVSSTLSWRPILPGSFKLPVQVTNSSKNLTNAVVYIVDKAFKKDNVPPQETYGQTTGTVDLITINPTTGEEIEGLLTASTIDYSNGKVTVKATSGTNLVSADTMVYSYDNRSVANGQIGTNAMKVPGVEIEIKSMPVICKTRKLKALYAFDSAAKLTKEYGSDINALLNSQIASEIVHEIDAEIMNDLYDQAGLENTPWSAVQANGISLREHYESFLIRMVEGSNKIFNATKRASANFIIVGVDVATIIESLPSYQPSGATDVVGPHIAGSISGLTVIKNPYYPSTGYVLGYKGTTIFDAGYIYSPYLPLTTTDTVMLDDFVGRKGWATSYATKMVQPRLYCRGSIVKA